MRKKLIAGNWKMNCLKSDGLALTDALLSKVAAAKDLPFEILICPPMSLAALVADRAQNSALKVGVENVTDAPQSFGAYTGEVSADMVVDLGCSYTLAGHSERRQMYGETDAVIQTKALNAMKAGLVAIVCVGETLEEREAGKALSVVTDQIKNSVPASATAENCVIAYEPVWAIGTGKIPTTADVAQVHQAIRDQLATQLGADVAAGMRILYGGSVKPGNAKELLAIDNVDGALIGGASLKADDFWAIAQTQF